MRRRPKLEGDRPPIPEHLRRFNMHDWIEERPGDQDLRERWARGERPKSTPEQEQAFVERSVRARRRYEKALRQWATAHGYSEHETYEATRPGPVVDPPKWRRS